MTAALARSAPLVALAILSCSGGSSDKATGPAKPDPVPSVPKPGFTLSGSANSTDTIGSRLSQPLRIVLRDVVGQPAPGKAVRLNALRATSGSFEALALIQTTTGSDLLGATLSTASDGSVEIGVTLGGIAGSVGITVQTLDPPIYADTAWFTALPGAATSITSSPADTAVAVGGSYTVTSVVRDRRGNSRPEVPVYRALNGSITLSSSRLVTSNAIARSGVVVSSGDTIADTAWISIVPPGTMAMRQGSIVRVVEIDGQRVADVTVPSGSPNPPLPVPGPEWTPDGQAFYSLIGSQGDPISLYRIDLTGTRTLVGTCSFPACTPPSSTVFGLPGGIASYSPSADGRFVYLSAGGCNYEGILYQAQLGSGGTALRISPPNANDCLSNVHRWPSISPDGSTIAFENDTGYFDGFGIQLLDVATRTIQPIRLPGQRPRWSPTGDLVAFVDAQAVWVVRPDGSGLRRVTTSNRQYLPGATWSPDARWLLAHATIKGQPMVVVVEVATGMELPLAFTSGWYDSAVGAPVPVWRPGS